MKTIAIIITIIGIIFFSCQEKKEKEAKTYPSDLPVIDLRGLISEKGDDDIRMFSAGDWIEYIPLDTFPEICGYRDALMTENHIFLIQPQYKGVVMYDRIGKFQKHLEEPFHVFELLYNECAQEVYVMGKENVWVLNEKTGEPIGDTQTLYNAPPLTQLYPLSPDRFLALYGRDNFYVTKTRAAICDKKGQLLTDTVKLTPDEIEKHVCWWSGKIFVMNDDVKNYLFFNYFPGNSYQTIFKASVDKIVPVYYLDVESDVDLERAWKFKDSLYFVFSYWLRGYSDTRKHITLAMFDTKTHVLKSKRLYNELLDSSAKYGIENNIDQGLPIQYLKQSCSQKWVLDVIASWQVKGYLRQNKIKENAPEFLKQMNEESSPVLSVVHYN